VAGLPVAVRELSQPAFDTGSGGVDLPAVGEDQQPGRAGSSGQPTGDPL